MKEQTLLQMKNSIARNMEAMNFMFQEVDKLQSFSVGIINVLKKMPGYDEAIKQLAIEQSEAAEKLKEEETVQVKAEDLASMIVNDPEIVEPTKPTKKK